MTYSSDYTNHMALTAGNPDLRLPVERRADISLSTLSRAMGISCNFSSSFTYNSNITGYNTEYFGSGWQFDASIGSGFYVKPIKSRFVVTLGAMIAKSPFMTDGITYMNGTDELSAKCIYFSSFSDVLTVNADLDYGLGLNTVNSDKVYSYSRINLGAQPSLMLFGHWSIKADYNLYAMLTDRAGAGYMINRLNFSTGYSFGKSTNYEISLDVLDVLNFGRNTSVDVVSNI